MSYCPNCGRKIEDETQGCPVCGKTSPTPDIIDGECRKTLNENTNTSYQTSSGQSEQQRGTSYSYSYTEYRDQSSSATEQTLHPALKVLIIVLIIITGGIGPLVGLIGGIILMKSPVADYRSFGKTMITVSVVLLVLSLLCCVAAGLFGFAASAVPFYY